MVEQRTKKINEFIELEEIDTDQYLLGIDDLEVGNGAKIRFDNFVKTIISTDGNNSLVSGQDGKLLGTSALNYYDENKSYNIDDWVLGKVNNVQSIYKSLQNNNVNHDLSDTEWWQKVQLGGGGELNNPFNLFDCKYSDHKIFNVSWLQSESQYNSRAIYTNAYEALQIEYNDEIEVGETVTLPSGASYIKQGLSVKLSTETYNDYDFVLNTSDETFRLPLKSNLASGKAVVGNGMTLGLFDGTSDVAAFGQNYGIFRLCPNSPVPYGSDTSTTGSTVNVNNNLTLGVTTDPTKSGMELSDNNLYLYYYVGETVQNAELIDVGAITEEIADIKSNIVTDEYVNGTSGYRIWASGYCEQWGQFSSTSVTLLKTYEDKNYNLLITYGVYNRVSYGHDHPYSKTPNSFTVGSEMASATYGYGSWRASGYLAEGEY